MSLAAFWTMVILCIVVGPLILTVLWYIIVGVIAVVSIPFEYAARRRSLRRFQGEDANA